MKRQCPYVIKQLGDNILMNCKFDENHEGSHVPYSDANDQYPATEGNWQYRPDITYKQKELELWQ